MKNIKRIYKNNRENLRTIEKTIMSDKVFAWLILFVIILFTLIFSTEEVEVIEKVQGHQVEVKKPVETQKVLIKWNNRSYAVQVWGDRVETMRKLGYSETRILDLLAIMNMECGSYKGDCFNGNDIGPMQINKIHKEQYNKSWEIYNRESWGELFLYQLDYANKLLDSYDKRFCGVHIFKQIGKTYTNKRHFECIGKSYNGHPQYKFAYVQLGWDRREKIKSLMK